MVKHVPTTGMHNNSLLSVCMINKMNQRAYKALSGSVVMPSYLWLVDMNEKMFYLTKHSAHFIYIGKGPLFFRISSKGSFICTTDRTAHITTFITPVMEHWLEQEIA